MRFPIADAHYAMGFAFLYEATGEPAYLEKAVHFLEELKDITLSRLPGILLGLSVRLGHAQRRHQGGTPLITTTPYVFEAFLQVPSTALLAWNG